MPEPARADAPCERGDLSIYLYRPPTFMAVGRYLAQRSLFNRNTPFSIPEFVSLATEPEDLPPRPQALNAGSGCWRCRA